MTVIKVRVRMVLIKDEVRILFDQFHANEVIPKGMLAYFVALIPKVSSPMALKDYRPISLIGFLYKLLAKVLARRLAGVMNSIIQIIFACAAVWCVLVVCLFWFFCCCYCMGALLLSVLAGECCCLLSAGAACVLLLLLAAAAVWFWLLAS